ncbi:sp110 nuclear body protein isoform X5 [Dasypus novemcinctus]|uniref:sp110 nuclear body protein isoform X5 n=1 Tax=Dasypus novemcinctus TaxID=9361 RepID=UPI00062A8F0A|nr:sp110 nuclear body protein isoform X4 [Dasypus novemcinctus]
MSTASRALEKALHQHFRYQKLEISYAIHKPFPFFEGLRDNSFITERTYLESLEACENLIPVSKVVYHLLTKLEETFDLSLLVTLFSQINLQEYPKLTTILRSFRSVGTSCGEGSRAKPVPSTTPADPAEGSSLQALLPLPPPQPPPPSPPPCARRCESEASAQQSKETLAGPRNPSDPAPALPGFIPKRRTVPVVRDDSPKPNAPEESQQAPNTSPNKKDSTDDGKKPSSQKSPEQRKKRTKNCNLSSSKKRQEKGLPRVSEKLEDETMDFQSPTLPVTCGEAKGILHKEKMKKGASEKCIQNKKGVWFTPKEFEREGNRAKAKNWKRSIRCRGKTLQHLLKKELLLCPPRINQKRKMFLEPSGSPLFEALFPVPANESLLRCA